MTQSSETSFAPRPARFAHVVYKTYRFDEMLDWYETVFGASVQYRNEALAFLTYDDEHHRFAFADMSVLAPGGNSRTTASSTGVDHVAYTYNSVKDLMETYARLKSTGITPYWSVHHGITMSLYYADPDGNQMEFQVDCLKTGEEATRYMNEKWGANPVGVEFEPDRVVEQLRSGAPESDFLNRMTDEPVSPLRGSIAELLG